MKCFSFSEDRVERNLESKMPEDSEIIDRWRYVVVLAKFVVHLLQPGLTKAMSVLIPSMVFQLNLNYTTAGFLLSLQISLLYIASPMSNYLSTKFGPRLLSTISGFLGGLSLMGASFSQSTLSLGCSFFFAGLFSSPVRQTSTVILHEHFGEMYGMAITFAQMGGLLGGILLPYVTVLCLEAYGMRGTLLCLSGILFFQTASGATMRPPRHYKRTQKKCKLRQTDDEERTPLQDGCSRTDEISLKNLATDENYDRPELHKGLRTKEERSVTETRHSKSSWNCIADFVSSVLFIDLLKKERVFTFLFLPCQFLGEVSFAVWLTFCVSYGLSVGMAEKEATYLVMAGSLGGFIGRLILMAILYKYPRLSPYMFPVNLAVSSVALFAYPINSSLLYLLVCSFFVGFGLYSAFSAFYAAISLKVKRGNFPLAIALNNLICGGMFLISGTFAGFLYEILGSFQIIFLITGFFGAIPCLAFSMYFYFDNRQQGYTCTSSED